MHIHLNIMKSMDTIIKLQMCNNTPSNYYQIHQKSMFYYSIQQGRRI
jgi:hypothetical protein